MFVGYRGWLVRIINNEPTLVSPSYAHMPWAPGENTAQCPVCILTMDESCNCGFYALKEPAPELVGYGSDIIGQVFLWSRVIEGDRGFRAKKAAVSILLIPSIQPLPEEVLDRLSARYNVPLIKAEGQILKGITMARRRLLIETGQLKFVAAMEGYKKDFAWMGRPKRSGDRL